MVFRTMIRDSSFIYDIVGLESEGTTVDFQVGANSQQVDLFPQSGDLETIGHLDLVTGVFSKKLKKQLQHPLSTGALVVVDSENQRFLTASVTETLSRRIVDLLAAFHRHNPLVSGLAKEELRTESSKLSNNLGIITARQEFTQGMINVLRDGAAGLTNADMNEEGANMLMLQTRQALGTTSLSLASQAAQSVLRLF